MNQRSVSDCVLFLSWFIPQSKSEAIPSLCFGYKNKTTCKSISFWQVDIVHKLIIFKITPKDFLFKLRTKYTVCLEYSSLQRFILDILYT